MKKHINITIPEEVLAAIKSKAAEEERNISNMVTVLVQRGLEKTKAA